MVFQKTETLQQKYYKKFINTYILKTFSYT